MVFGAEVKSDGCRAFRFGVECCEQMEAAVRVVNGEGLWVIGYHDADGAMCCCVAATYCTGKGADGVMPP